jgi:hypothetical protein
MVGEEWSSGILKPEFKKLVNEILGAVAKNKATDAFRAITEAFEAVKTPALLCVDAETEERKPFDQINQHAVSQHIMAMALGSNGRYIREKDFSLDDWDDHIPVLTHGLKRGKIIRECISRGRTFYHLNTGYLGNNPGPKNPEGQLIYHRIVKNDLQHVYMPERKSEDDKDYAGERWEALGIRFKGIKPGEKILIIPPDQKVIEYFGIFGHRLDAWLDQTIEEIKKHTGRPIQIRKRPPRAEIVSTNTMEDALENTHCLVTFSSISALEALVYGKPSIALGPNCAQAICETRLDSVEHIKHPGREAIMWLCRYLANNQFTFAEMLNGYAWSKIK